MLETLDFTIEGRELKIKGSEARMELMFEVDPPGGCVG